MIDQAGVERFARYAVPPNRHGYCGPHGFGTAASDPGRIEVIRHTAHEFIGASHPGKTTSTQRSRVARIRHGHYC